MATVTPPIAAGEKTQTAHQALNAQVRSTQRHVKTVELISCVLTLSCGLLGYLVVLALVDHWIVDLGIAGRALALLALLAGCGWFVARNLLPLIWHPINPVYAAREIELACPSLKNRLINLLLLRAEPRNTPAAVFQTLEQQVERNLATVAIDSVVDRSRVIRLAWVLTAIVVFIGGYKVVSPKDPLRSISRVLAPWADLARPSRVQILDVTPGSTTAFPGQRVTIRAQIEVHGISTPAPLHVVYATQDGSIVNQSIALRESADGQRYEATLPESADGLQQSLRYHLEAGDARSPDFLIDLLPAPTIDVERIEYEFPAYTAKPRSTLANQGDIQALEGTRVTIFAKANQPLRSATLEFDPSSRTAAMSETRSGSGASREGRSTPRSTINMRVDDRTATCSFDLKLDAERRKPFAATYQLRMETTQGHANERPIVHTIQVVPDLPPEIEILQPQQDLIEVPEDGSMRIEVRAIDPDFGLRRIQLRAVSGAQEVLNTHLLDAAPTAPGQNVVDYRLVPRKLMLQAGDEISYWAIAEDGRTAVGSTAPEPNSERTRAYRIRITAAEKPTEAGAEPTNAADEQESTQPDKTPGRPNIPSAPEDKPKNPRNKPKNEQGDTSGNKSNDPNAKGNQQQGGAGNPDESAEGDAPDQKPDEQPMGGGAGKSSKKPSGKDGDKNSGNDPPSGDQQSGDQQSGDQPSGDQPSGDQPSGDQPSDEPSDNSDPKDSGNARSGAKGGSQRGGQGDRSESPADGDPPDSGEMADSTGSSGQSRNASGKSASGKTNRNQPTDPSTERGQENDPNQGETQGDPASKPDTGNATKRETGKTSENDPAPNENAANGDRQQGGNQDSAQDTANSPPRSDSPHDGEVFERALERLRNQKANQQPGSKSSQEKDAGAQGDSSKSDQRDTDPGNPDVRNPDERNPDKPNGNPKGDNQPGDNQSGNNQAGDRNSENDSSDQPGEPSSPEKSRKRGEQDAAGSQSDESSGDTKNGNEGNSSNSRSGSRNGGQQNADRNRAEPDLGKPSTEPSRTDKRDQKSGSGEPDEENSGDSDSGEGNTEKNRDNDGGSDTKSRDSGKNSTAKTNQGSGKSNDPRNTNPKDSSTGDDVPSGEANNDSNRNSKTNERDNNQRPDPSRSKEREDRTGSQRDRSGESDRGSYAESRSTAGEPAKIDREVPDGPEANQAYARKATDLALEYLKNQRENPDPKLLKELGWTPEELNAFVNRWEALKRDAKENPARRQELDSTLESLGLRPARDIKRRTTTRSDGAGGNQDAGNRSAPPASYQDQINAFRKGVSRSRDRDGK